MGNYILLMGINGDGNSQSSRIAAYKLGFDYVGCELDKEYFDKGCERFNRECKGEIRLPDGRVAKQLTLFDYGI